MYFNKIRTGRRGGDGSSGERVGGVIATCHFIQLHFNLGCLEESRSANDFGGGVVALQGGREERFELLIPRNKSPGYELFVF